MRAPEKSQELHIESPDGATVRARVFLPRREEPAMPVSLVLPAMGVRASFYEALALALSQSHMPAVTVDLRGQGESSERAARGSNFGYREIVELDLPAAASSVEARFPGRALLVIGHSLGGQLAALALARRNLCADGLVLAASGSAHWWTWPLRTRAKAGVVVAGVALAGQALPWYPGDRLGFGGDQPRRLIRDWSRNALTGRYPLEPAGPLSGTPVLSLEIEGDPVAPAGAARALLSYFDSSWVIRRTLSPSRPGEAWKQHFAWVREPLPIVSAIRAWMISGRASRGYGFLRRELRGTHERVPADRRRILSA